MYVQCPKCGKKVVKLKVLGDHRYGCPHEGCKHEFKGDGKLQTEID
jgi:endogenous inhibitor of DNA gyrase (YacG/DUF329 family)